MKTNHSIPYKENRIHGSRDFPCSYYWADRRNFLPDEIFHAKHHWHEEVEFLYLEKGSFELEINMQKYSICEEAFCFIGSGALHSICCFPEFIEKAIVFSPSMLCFQTNDTCQQKFIEPLLTDELSMPRIITQKNSCFSGIKQAYLQIVSCFMNAADLKNKPVSKHEGLSYAAPGDQLCIKASLLLILSHLAQEGLLSFQPSSPDPRTAIIKKTISYMKEHYKEQIYIKDLADLANMNEQYFCRFFKQSIGHPPIEYLNELRIKQAMDLLLTTDFSVVDISLECGFNNLGNFMRTFKKNVQTTPLQYRKNSRRKDS